MKEYKVGNKTINVGCYFQKTSYVYTNEKHNLYKICISIGNEKMFLKYHDSTYNYQRGGYPKMENIIKRLIEDSWEYSDNKTVKNFAEANNYNLDKETYLDFKDCRKAFYKLHKLLTNKEIEELYEIVSKN